MQFSRKSNTLLCIALYIHKKYFNAYRYSLYLYFKFCAASCFFYLYIYLICCSYGLRYSLLVLCVWECVGRHDYVHLYIRMYVSSAFSCLHLYSIYGYIILLSTSLLTFTSKKCIANTFKKNIQLELHSKFAILHSNFILLGCHVRVSLL